MPEATELRYCTSVLALIGSALQ